MLLPAFVGFSYVPFAIFQFYLNHTKRHPISITTKGMFLCYLRVIIVNSPLISAKVIGNHRACAYK